MEEGGQKRHTLNRTTGESCKRASNSWRDYIAGLTIEPRSRGSSGHVSALALLDASQLGDVELIVRKLLRQTGEQHSSGLTIFVAQSRYRQ